MKTVPILNYIPYNKSEVKSFLQKEFSWRDYGAKHYESRFTKFFQSYYLPTKFGYDKRRAHLSSLIVSGQITREDALKKMEQPSCTQGEIKDQKEYVAKKLEITVEEFDRIIALPAKTYRDYPSNEFFLQLRENASRLFRKYFPRSV